ncbi:M20/M25/M40 family metallo-hydrolase [Brassicibacter mesophilus]|uniref:M20/M25/M40 family metallo-hydrolase n=1 Tax=Brassicibacter mesophilus TaxID=745119 RepID=UPI003D1D1A11
MLNNKNKYIVLLLVICIVLSGCSSISTVEFNEENAHKHIEQLSSVEYGGRLPGTEGNEKAVKYIAEEFKKIGLEPYSEDSSYLQTFKVISPILQQPTKLEVLDKNGNIVKQYELREDFREITSDYAFGGSARGKVKATNFLDEIKPGKDEIILTSMNTHDKENTDKLIEKGVKAVIKPSNTNQNGLNKDLFIKSTYVGEKESWQVKEGFIEILVTEKVFNELLSYSKKDYTLDINLNLTFPKLEISNVIGYIPGNDRELKEEALIISAHFDHVGTDPNGKVYGGALDNASGTGMLIELARAIKESEIKPRRTIIFAAFNAEESGCQGSLHYTDVPLFSLNKTVNINLDMVGSKEEVKLMLSSFPSLSSNKKMNEFLQQIRKVLDENKVEYNTDNYSDSSDHWSFNYRGVPAVTFSHPSEGLIHTPDDTIENINVHRLDEVGELVLSCIDYYAYAAKDKTFSKITEEQIHTLKLLLLYLVIIALVCIIAVFMIKVINKNSKLKKLFGGKPIFSSVIFILLLLGILIYNSSYGFNASSVIAYNSKPWENTVTIKGNDIKRIYDGNVDGKLVLLLKGDKGLKQIVVNVDGLVEQESYINDISTDVDKIRLYNDNILYLENRSLYNLDRIHKNKQKIIDNIEGFNIAEVENELYIVGYNEQGIIIKNNSDIKNINAENIIDIYSSADNKGRVHILFKERNSGEESVIKYALLEPDGNIVAPKEIYSLKNNASISFGVDKSRGYVFFKESTDCYYLTFYLGDRKDNYIKKQKLELHDSAGALIKISEAPYISSSNKSNNAEVTLVASGKNALDTNYICIIGFLNGKIIEEEILTNIKKENTINPILIESNYDKYAAWLEGKNNDYVLKIKSSDSKFGANSGRMILYIRLGNMVQNIFLMVLTMIRKLYWILPGCIILIISKIVKKDSWQDNRVIITAAILCNTIFQILFYRLPEFLGFRYEGLIITVIISLISVILVLIYKHEKREVSYFRLYVIFTVMSMIFISTLYAPYTIEGGMDKLKQTEMFKGNERE